MLPTHRPPTHPGEMLLKEFLEPLGVSQVEAARRMNIPFQRLNAIIKGRRGVSADTALLPFDVAAGEFRAEEPLPCRAVKMIAYSNSAANAGGQLGGEINLLDVELAIRWFDLNQPAAAPAATPPTAPRPEDELSDLVFVFLALAMIILPS